MLALTLTIGAGTMNFSKSFLPKADAFNVTPGVRFLKKRLKRETFRIYSPEMFYPSLASAFRIPDIRYLSAIVPNSLIDSLTTVLGPLGKDKVAFDRFETVNAIPSGFDHPSYDILNVRYFVFSKDSPRPPVSPSLKLVYDGEDMKIIENRDSMRSYFAMKAWKIYSSLPAMKEELWKAPEGMREVIPLLEEPIFVPLASPSPARNKIVGKESVKLTSENNHTHIFKVNLDAPRLLTISQVLMPGYRALRSDGAELPILSSYGGLITVPLSSGEYSVTLRYRPFYWTASLVACGFGLLVLIGGGVWLRVTSQLLP